MGIRRSMVVSMVVLRELTEILGCWKVGARVGKSTIVASLRWGIVDLVSQSCC